MNWQRRARLLVVAVAIAVTAAVWLTSRRREPPPRPAAVSRVDPAAVVESSGAFVRDVKGEKERFRVEAGRQLTYSDGRTKLMAVKVTVERTGKTFVLTGDEARVGENQSSVHLDGHVHLAGSDGLVLNASTASYTESEGIVRAPGPVTFSRGTMTGSGNDFTYDRDRDAIGLADKSLIKVAGDEKDPSGADIKAGAALLARKDRFMSFERDVHIIRGKQVIDADRAVADLTADEKHVSALDLNGTSRITQTNAGPGGLAGMAADNIVLTYAQDSDLIEKAVLAGTSTIKIAGEKNGPDKTLAAESLQVGLAPDGTTVTSLNAKDKVSLDLPAPKGEPSKNIKSTALTASGEPEKGLTAAQFSEGVEYREFGGTPAVQRLVRSRSLDTTLKNGFAEISDARFSGGVQFTDGGTRATSANVRYQSASGHVDLTGNVGNSTPHVVDDEIDVAAGHIDMVLDGPKLVATEGPVKTVLKPAKPGAGNPDAARMPGLMEQDRPVNGSSDKLTYDGANGSKAEFAGHARLFQGDTLVQAETVVVDGKSGNLQADGTVASRLIVNDIDPETKKPTPSRATASAGSMHYDDATRSITYTTGAHLNGPQGDVTAVKIILTLARDSQDVAAMDATGTVTLRENDRVTTGDHLGYTAEGESYTMSGKPAKMVEADCHQNTGTVLQFEKATDRLRIEGNDDSRTQSNKAAPGCVPRPPH